MLSIKWIIFSFLTILAAAYEPVNLLFLESIIDSTIGKSNDLINCIFYFCIVSFGFQIIIFIKKRYEIKVKGELYKVIPLKILKQLCKIPYLCFENVETYETIRRMGEEPQEHIWALYDAVMKLVFDIIRAVFYMIVFFRLSVWIAVVGILAFFLLLFLDTRRIKMMVHLYEEQTKEERTMDAYEEMINNKSSLCDLRVAGAIKWLLQKRKVLGEKIIQERLLMTKRSQRAYVYGNLMTTCWMGIVICFLIHSLLNDKVSLGPFIAVMGVLQQILVCFRCISEEYAELRRRIEFVGYYKSFLRLEQEEVVRQPLHFDKDQFVIKFDHVTFTYPGVKTPALRDITFSFNSQERIALVGHNGSGKTTLVKLLCGLYQPDQGKIFLNDVPIDKISREVLRACLSVVFQDYGRYYFTIRENVELGNVENKRNQNERERDILVKKALRDGLAEEFSDRLDQTLGNFSSQGMDLSGGQWQRIALARACYHGGKMMVLDEPTAALDPVAEYHLYSDFLNMLHDRACILISHRLAVTRYVDRILVMERGEIVEEGNHETLMKQNGIYAKMYELQSGWYQ